MNAKPSQNAFTTQRFMGDLKSQRGHRIRDSINRRATPFGIFEVCVLTHVALRMFIMQVLASQLHFLASQLHFLANRNAELAVPPLFWPVNCIKIGGHVALLMSCPSIYFLFYDAVKVSDILKRRRHLPTRWRYSCGK